MNDKYEKDFCGWSEEQAELLRKKETDKLDFSNLANEIEGLNHDIVDQVEKNLLEIVVILLKLKYLPKYRNRAIKNELTRHRIEVYRLIRKYRTLEDKLANYYENIWKFAALRFKREAGMSSIDNTVPKTSLWIIDTVMDYDYFP